MKCIKMMIVVSLILSMGAITGFAKTYKIKFSHVVAVDTPKGEAAEYFKKIIEKRSNGKFKVEIYPNASLYGDREAIEALKMNAIQIAAPSFSKFTGFVPQIQLFDLPFLFKDQNHLHKVLDGEVGQEILKLVSKRGLVGLAYWDNGFKELSDDTRPLIKPSDAKGLKFRIMSSKVLEAQFKAVGANPQVLPFSEVYSALQQGVVNGQENTLSNIYTKKIFEVQKYMTISDHGYLGYMLVTNKIFMKKLPDNLKKIFLQAVKDATAFGRKQAQAVNLEYLKKIKASGKVEIHYLTPEEKQVWKKKMMTIYPKFYKVVGKDLITRAME